MYGPLNVKFQNVVLQSWVPFIRWTFSKYPALKNNIPKPESLSVCDTPPSQHYRSERFIASRCTNILDDFVLRHWISLIYWQNLKTAVVNLQARLLQLGLPTHSNAKNILESIVGLQESATLPVTTSPITMYFFRQDSSLLNNIFHCCKSSNFAAYERKPTPVTTLADADWLVSLHVITSVAEQPNVVR